MPNCSQRPTASKSPGGHCPFRRLLIRSVCPITPGGQKDRAWELWLGRQKMTSLAWFLGNALEIWRSKWCHRRRSGFIHFLVLQPCIFNDSFKFDETFRSVQKVTPHPSYVLRKKKICNCIIIKLQSIKTLNNISQDKETSVWKENSYRSLCSATIKRGSQHQRRLKTIISNSKEPLCVKDSRAEERFLWRGLDQSVFCLSLSLCWDRKKKKSPNGSSLSLNCSKGPAMKYVPQNDSFKAQGSRRGHVFNVSQH